MLRLNEEWKQANGLYECPYCKKIYSKNGISTHIWRNHTEEGKQYTSKPSYGNKGKKAWNRGLNKNNDERIKKGVEKWNKNLKEGKFKPSQFGRPLSEEHRNHVSESMKKAHKEGRAWNIGMSRWNNESSYPEKFFMKVIENEFEDKNYQKEYPFGIYSLDFAWVEKKKVIEIDGDQHKRFEEYIERDKRKDQFLKDNDWEVLRISWNDMFHNTKEEINRCKNFINSC